ncbi:hypothetical protein Ddye_019270 [Dipteronia dyeriana]|uniref:PGG domain-containing protein n=1 Tax=Dipteronia dyeriana TaxID=168575 RepID=A0AAD9TXK6_9ROSI|nr:hypothetical protein Ddye_019270 [Dipteronia dyeriana]
MENSRIKTLYKNVLDKDWNALKRDFSCENDVDPLKLLSPISVHGYNIIQLVVHSGTKEPLKQILGRVKCTRDLDLLHCFTRSKNSYGNTVLHEAAISGNLEAVMLLVENDEEIIEIENDSNETALFKAAAFGNTKIVNFLASCEGQTVTSGDGTKKLKDVHRNNKNGDTVLFAAVQGQHFGTALELLKLDENLTELENGNQTSFYMLAKIPSVFNSKYELGIWKKLLFFCVPVGCDHNDNIENSDQDIESGNILRRGLLVCSDHNRAMEDGDVECGLTRFCPAYFAVLCNIYLSIWRHIFKGFPVVKKIWKEKRDYEFACELAQKLTKKDIYSWKQNVMKFVFSPHPEIKKEELAGNPLFAAIRSGNVEAVTLTLEKYPQQLEKLNQKILNYATEEEEGEAGNILFDAIRTGIVEYVKMTLEKYPQQLELLNHRIRKILLMAAQEEEDEPGNPILFTAIRTGNIKVVKLILEEYPQALEQINHRNQNILHVAAMYRQKRIFDLMKTKEIPMKRMAQEIDDNGYTILHSVADIRHYKGGTTSGPAYQLQEELKWFMSVKEIMPTYYTMLRANNKKSALEILKENHVEQLKKAQSWIKETSQSCSGVAVLVSTVVFAAAFTVPGGTDDSNGNPILLHSRFFMYFTVMDIVSLSCSLTSVVMFLSILTSPFELEDFLVSLPRKLTIGFFFLLLSVATTMLTFTSTIILIIRSEERRKWTVILIYSAAFLPLSALALTQLPLLMSFIRGRIRKAPKLLGN